MSAMQAVTAVFREGGGRQLCLGRARRRFRLHMVGCRTASDGGSVPIVLKNSKIRNPRFSGEIT